MAMNEVVFSPNLEESPTFGLVYLDFMKHRIKPHLKSWTCKKTARPGDLYLFYFGAPIRGIAGMAVVRDPPDPKGWKPRGRQKKMFFCSFEQLNHFAEPLTVEQLRTNPVVAAWWDTKPFRGSPKSIPEPVCIKLFKMLNKLNRKVNPLVRAQLDCLSAPENRKPDVVAVEAWEGTVQEFLSRQRVRSQKLRDGKIRDSLLKNGGRLICEVPKCNFDFLQTYGEIGRGFAHVHHKKPLAKRRAGRTNYADLAIVCANCHAMIHRRGRCRALRDLLIHRT
jgi:hypothetical protein